MDIVENPTPQTPGVNQPFRRLRGNLRAPTTFRWVPSASV